MSANYNRLSDRADDGDSNSSLCDEQTTSKIDANPPSKDQHISKCHQQIQKCPSNYFMNSLVGSHSEITDLKSVNSSVDDLNFHCSSKPLTTKQFSASFSIIENPVLSHDSMPNSKSNACLLKTSTVVTTLDGASTDKLHTTLTSLVLETSEDFSGNLDTDVEHAHSLLKLSSSTGSSDNSNESHLQLSMMQQHKLHQKQFSTSKWTKSIFETTRSLSLEENSSTSVKPRPKSLHETHSTAFKHLLSDNEEQGELIHHRASSLTFPTKTRMAESLRKSNFSLQCNSSERHATELLNVVNSPTLLIEEPNIQSNLLANYDSSTEYVFKPLVSHSLSSTINSTMNKLGSKSNSCSRYHYEQPSSGATRKFSLSGHSSLSSTPCIADVNGQTSFKVSSTDVSTDKFIRSNNTRSFGGPGKKSVTKYSGGLSTHSSLTRSKSLSSNTAAGKTNGNKRKSSENSADMRGLLPSSTAVGKMNSNKRKGSESSAGLEIPALTAHEGNCEENSATKSEESVSSLGLGNFLNM